jgi:hypothetical protein
MNARTENRSRQTLGPLFLVLAIVDLVSVLWALDSLLEFFR